MPSASREAHGQLDGNGNQANSGHGHYQRVASPHRPRESRLCRYPAGRPDYIPRTRLAAYAYRHSTMTATAPTRGSCRTSTSITSPSRRTSSRNVQDTATCMQVPSWAARGSVVWLRREHCLRMARMPAEMRERPGGRKRRRSTSLTLP